MKVRTFKNGVRVPHKKYAMDEALKECPAPETVYIPLSQHIGKPATPVVAVGDGVKAGTLVARGDGYVSANIFSSVSGTVEGVVKRKTPSGECDHIAIKNDGRYEPAFLPPLEGRSREELLARIKDAGLVGMGGAGFPAHVKYSPKTPVDTFILNAAECEPYITCDYRLLIEHTDKVLKGALLLAKALGLDSVTVGLEDNKPLAKEAIEAFCSRGSGDVKLVMLKSKYPQGAEKQLIYAATGRKVPLGKLPADVGAVVGNVHTAYAMFEAAEENIPLFRRAMTVSGGGVKSPANLWVRTGTLYSDCIKAAGGFDDDCFKLISGGPMMGAALVDLECAVTKTSGSLLALEKDEANTAAPAPCINCGRCAKACPMRLMPMYIDQYTQRGDYAAAKRYGAEACIECGCCAYSCPAKRPIVQAVRLAKRKLKEMNR